MALILALDPDGGQASALERVGSELAGHELLSAGSCPEALDLMGRRVPDLVLLPALLPEAEEVALRSRLHAAPRRVLTLTLPMLAAEESGTAGRLGQWTMRLRPGYSRGSTAPCDPGVFAAQVREYLAAECQPGTVVAEPGEREEGSPEARRESSGISPEQRAQLLAAARRTAEWVRARRLAQAQATPARPPREEPVTRLQPVASYQSLAEIVETEPLAVTPIREGSRAVPEPRPLRLVSRAADNVAGRASSPAEPPAGSAPRAWQVRARREAVADEDRRIGAAAPLDTPARAEPTDFVAPPPGPMGLFAPEEAGPPFGRVEVVPSGPMGLLSDEAAETRVPIGWRIWYAITSITLPGIDGLPLRRAAGVVAIVALGAAGHACWPAVRAAFNAGTVVLDSAPSGSHVLVDGRRLGVTPLIVNLPAGSHTVEFRDGAASRTREIVVVPRARTSERLDWTAKPSGGLEVDSAPAGARVLLDGDVRGVTPLTLAGVEAGEHTLVLENETGTVRRSVKIAAGETAQVTESMVSGWLAVFAPFEIEVSEGGRPLALDERGRAMLGPGPHELRFTNDELGYTETRRVDIKPSATAALTLTPAQTSLSVKASVPSEVWIDGQHVGETPVADAPVPLGTREVVVKTASGAERRYVVTATTKPASLDVDYSTPQP